jgi:predicted secreted Zn-dependent protease
MRAGTLTGSLLLLLLAAEAAAQVYKWVDEKGRVQYGAHPPPAAKTQQVRVDRSHSANPAAGVEVPESEIKYYPVYGNSPQTLHQSMKANGPFNEIVQTRVYAEIEWRIRWKASFATKPGACKIDKFTISVPTTIAMPQWMDEAKAPPEMRSLWPRVVAKIRTHEDGHRAIAVEGANVLSRRMQALPAFETCEALRREIDREHQSILRDYSTANRAFDRTEALKDSPFKD